MDTSKEYIKMNYKAPKKLWDSVKDKDYSYMSWRGFIGIIVYSSKPRKTKGLSNMLPETLVIRTWLNENQDIRVIENTHHTGRKIYGTDEGTPLYRQDQLQEIMKSFGRSMMGLINDIADWMENDYLYAKQFKLSAEQLWLAFVMRALYKKKWNGEDWVADDKK